jgi:hypothetical protein
MWHQHTFPWSLSNLKGEGWGDIGYNYLIDPNGVIYEGRAGGDDIVGFHFCEQNSGTMGIGMLGTFTSELPTAQALTSLKKLLAWKAAQSQINPTGYSYHASSGLILVNIAGHRDGTCSTACPGNLLYAALPSIRNGVSTLVGPIQGDYVGTLDISDCNVIAGWVADRKNFLGHTEVQILDGDTVVTQVGTNQFRLDVAQYLGVMANFGFSIPTPTALLDGRSHSIRAKVVGSNYVLNNSGRSITCGTLLKDHVGSLDVADCTSISGWAADRSRPNTAVNVSIYDGATLLQTVLANGSRPDVGSYLSDNGLHGFTIPTPAILKNGQSHSISVKIESSAVVPFGSPKAITCTPPAAPANYAGSLDVADCTSISGWAADRSRPNTAVNVSIYDGGSLLQTVLANGSRPDVGSYLSDSGLHGFTIPTPAILKNGQSHSISVKIENSAVVPFGSPKAITCSSPTAPPNYAGSLDVADCNVIRGWAADRNRLNTSMDVSIYDGSNRITTVRADQSRPDVGTLLGDNGLHGFNITTPDTLRTGSHSVSVRFESSSSELSNGQRTIAGCAAQPTISTYSWGTNPRGTQPFGGTISGTGFVAPIQVWFCVNGSGTCYQHPSGGVTINSATNLSVNNVILSTGSWQIYVVTSAGASARSAPFTVQNGPPTISSYSWTTIPTGSQPFGGTIIGTEFVAPIQVWFCVNGSGTCYQHPSAGVTINSLTNLSVNNVSLSTGSWQIYVVTSAGASARSAPFTIR